MDLNVTKSGIVVNIMICYLTVKCLMNSNQQKYKETGLQSGVCWLYFCNGHETNAMLESRKLWSYGASVLALLHITSLMTPY